MARTKKKNSLLLEQNKSLFLICTVMIVVIAIVGFATNLDSRNNDISDSSNTSKDVINDIEYFKGK